MQSWMSAAVALAALAPALWVARRFLLVVRVQGTSMVPTFRPGEAVLARRRGTGGRLRSGQIVVCRLPERIPGPPGLLIKRVAAVAGQAIPGSAETVPQLHVYVCGDGPRSYDSRQFGPLPVASIVGYVIARLHIGAPSAGRSRSRLS